MKTKHREINLAAQNWMAIEKRLAVKMKRMTTTVWGEMPMTIDEYANNTSTLTGLAIPSAGPG